MSYRQWKLMTSSQTKNKSKQKKILDFISKKVGDKELNNFAKFVKNRLKEKDETIGNLTGTEKILIRLSEIFSKKEIPKGHSLMTLFLQFKAWHARNGAGVKRLGLVTAKNQEKESESTEEKISNISAEEAGGFTLQKIGLSVDPNRTFTPTAINDIIEKLTSENQDNLGKLHVMKKMIEHYLGFWAEEDEAAIKNFSRSMKRAVIQASGRYVDLFDQAREMDSNGETIFLDNLVKLLDKNKLRDSMSEEDIKRENLFLECLLSYANDLEFMNDDLWKDVVMEMLNSDLMESPIFATRDRINIVKSFQNMIATIVKPPPKRGRPKKNLS